MVYVSSVERIARKEGLEAGRAEGIEAGRAEGIQAGKAEGIQAGRAEGIAEAQEKACRTIRLSIRERLEQRWGLLHPELQSRLESVNEMRRLLDLHVLAATAQQLPEWVAELEA